jgi:hypothetical protein
MYLGMIILPSLMESELLVKNLLVSKKAYRSCRPKVHISPLFYYHLLLVFWRLAQRLILTFILKINLRIVFSVRITYPNPIYSIL